jgi:hypothetical protein
MATRKAIRTAIKDLIAPKFVKSFAYRLSSVDQRDLPLVMVYIEGGDSEVNHDSDYDSDGMLVIEIWTSNTDDIDSALDALGSEVNKLIESDETLSGLVMNITRTGYSYERDPESFTGSLALNFEVSYEDED